jgi:hypothetical protein
MLVKNSVGNPFYVDSGDLVSLVGTLMRKKNKDDEHEVKITFPRKKKKERIEKLTSMGTLLR